MQFLKTIIVKILTLESRLILRKYRPFIVAVTGSVGKTSTKDAIYCVLKNESKFVRKSEKSMNSEIGLPLTIIGAPNAWHSLSGWLSNIGAGLAMILSKKSYPDCLILEIGADHPGDIKKTVKWLHPDIAVITKVSKTPVHVEFFKSPEEVFEEKASLALAVKAGGSVVLFADDEKVMSIAEKLKDKKVKIMAYGLSASANVKGSEPTLTYADEETRMPSGFGFKIEADGKVFTISVKNVIGSVYTYPLLAAAAVGKIRNISDEKIIAALNTYEAPKGRLNLIAGINDSILIDDTYNSSPDAVSSALKALKNIQARNGKAARKIAVLGDMMELGKFASEEHRKIGREAAGIVSEIVTIGRRSQLTADEAVKAGFSASAVHSFDDSMRAAEYLVPKVAAGDVVLVKGSQSMRMERVVKALLKEPTKADKLLVRQEKEWLEKK